MSIELQKINFKNALNFINSQKYYIKFTFMTV